MQQRPRSRLVARLAPRAFDFRFALQYHLQPSFLREVALPVVQIAYFATMSIPIVAGRGFTNDDRASSQPVAVVNQTFVTISLWN